MMSLRSKLPEYWIPQDLKAVLVTNGEFQQTEKSEQFRNVLIKLENIDQLDLAQCHYLQFLKLALYLEEFQQNVDIRKFNLYGKKIERINQNSNAFKICIKDFDKDHPLHKSCNLIEILNPKDVKKNKFVLRTKAIFDDHVIAIAYSEFCSSYDPSNSYNIRFRSNNYAFRCSHYALSLINAHDMTRYLFPVKKKLHFDITTPISDYLFSKNKWFNVKIGDNPEQTKAVFNIIYKSSFPAPYILYGPPGTGKTATLVEAICQIWHKALGNILICAPSNTAADVITKRLQEYIPHKNINRIYGRSRDTILIDKDFKTCSNFNGNIIRKLNGNILSTKKIVISTLCTCTKLMLLDLNTTYSYVFIDEAGQSTEPESLIAFNAISRYGSSKCQIVISGDPQQLGPNIRSKYAAPILGQSLLERLMKLEPYVKNNNNDYDSCYITKLLRNYRSHPAIIRVSNELYYDNELIACTDETPFKSKDFPSEFPIIFHSVIGEEQKEINSSSSYNNKELKEVLEYVHLLIGKKIGTKVIEMQDIGIVTPFTLQSKHLQKTLEENNLKDVTVGTVEIFQGQEKEVIIFSTVRSKIFKRDGQDHIGFLSNPRRFNVALTRAKAVLVVVGNPKALQIDSNWRYFLKFCHDNDAYRGTKFELTEEIEQPTNDGVDVQRNGQSINMFNETFKLLEIDDGIIRQKKNKYLFNGLYYSERECAIL